MSEQIWTSDADELEQALRNPEGRVFRNRLGAVVDDVTVNADGSSTYPAYSERQGWFYDDAGQLYDNRESDNDIVEVGAVVPLAIPVVVETNDNPDFVRLLSCAVDAAAASTIRTNYSGYRLLDTLHLRVLGHTGKRKPCAWESVPGLRKLLDHDKLFDSAPWKISEGDDIHEVFEAYRPGSCMSSTYKHDLRQLYAINPTKVKTAHHTKTDCGLLQSAVSCLIWYGSDTVYIDRRYSEGYLPKVKEPLIRSLVRQLETSTGKSVKQIWKGDDIEGLQNTNEPVQVTLRRDGNLMPWCDSIRYVVDYTDDTVTLSTSDRGDRICCQDQSGQNITESTEKCCSCGCRVNEDNVSHFSGQCYCESCYSDSVGHCEYTDFECDADDIQSIALYGHASRYAARRTGLYIVHPEWHTMSVSQDTIDNYFTVLHDGRYAENDYVIDDNRGRTWCSDPDSWDDVVLTEDGELYCVDDVVQLGNGETHPKENCVEVDGEWHIQGTEPSVETSNAEVGAE